MDTTLLIAAARAGDKAAEARLFQALYADLHRMAQHHLVRSGSDIGHAQSLVHEVYLRLANAAGEGPHDRRHFFALASRAMRQIVVDHVRRRGAVKRGEGIAPMSLDEVREPALSAVLAGQDDDLLQLDAALARLERFDDGLARLVELHFFGGLGFTEMASVLERSERSLKRDWRKAKAFLYRDLAHESASTP
ncbi:ECF-type sigma factor [Xanthomonadaceae bacterium JHOS43]|nr:ECF-type sigma factor [Xanthomonadaceae bacterium JHOS43]MCX7562329.1 ECF-type sigma factor [Xanthomonadaceae bacterium XH05]